MHALLARLTLRQAIIGFVALAAAAACMLGGAAFVQNRMAEGLTDRLLNDIKLARAAGSVDMMHDALRGDVLSAQLTAQAGNASGKDDALKDLREHVKTMQEAFETVVQLSAAQSATRQAADSARPLVLDYQRQAEKTIQELFGGAGEASVATFMAQFDKLESELEALSGAVEKSAEDSVSQRDAFFANARLALGGTLALSVLALAGFSVVFPRLMYGRLGGEPAELRTLAQAIADGNLAARLDPRLLRQGSVGEALLKMRDALRDSVRTIRLSADQIAAGSAQIARGNDDLATRTEQQASRVQETASAMDQVKGSVAQTADHARSASELATRACDVAQRGGTAVGRMLTTMDDIQASSRKIAEIISTIDSIAFQTNILALNAAVEAARAGDHGRGFAVVASEVRALAQRSAAAAREIKDLIDASVAKVEAGHVQASDAGTTMREIVDQVQRVTALIGEISAAAAEQNGGIGGINQSVTEIDRTTQSNAALVEQSAASAATLAEQAQALNRSMERFQLAEG